MTFEQSIQSAHRLAVVRYGYQLWRNNRGVLKREDGTPVRFGLANDSALLAQKLASSDLIGWRSIVITPEMVGRRFAQFASHEIKEPGWTLRPGDKRAQAQLRWIELVNEAGGDGRFITEAWP